MQGVPVRGASILKSITFMYKYANCSSLKNDAPSVTYDTTNFGSVFRQTIREPKYWTTGAPWGSLIKPEWYQACTGADKGCGGGLKMRFIKSKITSN